MSTDALGRIGTKKNPFGFIFSNLRAVTDVLEHSNGAKAGLAHYNQPHDLYELKFQIKMLYQHRYQHINSLNLGLESERKLLLVHLTENILR